MTEIPHQLLQRHIIFPPLPNLCLISSECTLNSSPTTPETTYEMSKVPAWKRLGLQVKNEVDENLLPTTEHLEHDAVTNKLAKKLNKKRKQEQTSGSKEKKPPKRVKLPKLERKPPPEKDQLLYLRQYASDKENWKFSKQKQNWILKNIAEIPTEYENALITYVEGIQGGARDRLVPELQKVVDQWNEVAQKLEDKVNAELYGKKDEKEEEKAEETEKKEENEEKGPTREYAIRCKKLIHAITDDEVELKGIEEEDTEGKEEEEKESEKEDGAEQKGSQTEDNLVFDDIEVEDYQYSTQEEAEPIIEEKEKNEKKEKKAKKSKKEKKLKKSE